VEPDPPIHPMERHVPGRPFMRCQVHLPEGPARRVRSRTFDHPFALIGHDKRAPPFSELEGPARQVPVWRDVLVTSAVQCWIIRSLSPGTEVPRGKRG